VDFLNDDGTDAATTRGERPKVKRTRLTRREFLKGAGAAGAVLLGGALAGCNRLPQQLPEDYLPQGGPRMNVVVVIMDSFRKDHVGAYGNDWIKTPNVDVLANESLRFTQAYPESIPTINARRAIHTGTRAWPFKDWVVPKGEDLVLQGWMPIPEGQTTLAEVLSENGYRTMLVTDTMHQFKPSYNMHRGFDAFDFIRGQTTDNYQPNWTFPRERVRGALLEGNLSSMRAQMRQYWSNMEGRLVPQRESEEDWLSPRVFSRASEFLEITSGEDGPFFMVVDSYDPHEPWDTPEEYVSLYDDPYDGLEPYSVIYGSSDYLSERELQRMKARYAGEVTMADRWLGTFLDKMRELGLFENTLLVFLSDHGIAHGEHGYTGKPSYVLWPEVTDIPFLIRHPGGELAGETSDYHASTHDVAPTILGFLGIEPPEGMNGQDLSVLFGGGEPEQTRSYFTLGYNDHAWARDDRYVMFAKNDGSNALLFDLREDPNMDNDIAGSNQDIINSMWNDYVLKDAGGPLPRYNMASPPGRS
jgi:arylsulfatase A-like enzyme